MRVLRKKMLVMGCIGIIFCLCAGSMPRTQKEEPFKNLQILPKNISSKNLSSLMVNVFSDDVGMKCGTCHAKQKDSEKLDYASDAKPEKQIARKMMQMTLKINEQYFGIKKPMFGTSVLAISCVTCHNSQPHPDEIDPE